FALPTLAMLFHRQLRASATTVWSFLLVSLLSHSLLDSLTTGGKGVGWLWPWRDERFFAPWQVIRVAPFKLEAYLTARGE
ncbi:metal-dependent hydrolase, partial [Escherichia coli]|uniref:metal-dependent hydrolase n=2 Tax=Gammaproteobacteria TaxID=1236 RepID=UPI0028DF16F3